MADLILLWVSYATAVGVLVFWAVVLGDIMRYSRVGGRK